MADLTPRGAPAGHGGSKLRRKKLEIMHLDLGIEQRRVEVQEKEEEIERMEASRNKLCEELALMEQQLTARQGGEE
jgi:hypothetical protein